MMDAGGAHKYHAHPRTKGTTGYPDLIFDAWTKNDRVLGGAFKPGKGNGSVRCPACEWRCLIRPIREQFRTRQRPRLKSSLPADIDMYCGGPEDDLYPNRGQLSERP
jgi:hypothetical protein